MPFAAGDSNGDRRVVLFNANSAEVHVGASFTQLIKNVHPAEPEKRTKTMSKNQRQTTRTPATKFANLQKKMQQVKTTAKAVKKGKK